MGVREPCGVLNLGQADRAALALPGIGDVLEQGAVEQDRLLLHHRDLGAQGGLAGMGDLLAVDQDTAVGHVVEPLDQLDERGLAGAGAADQAYLLASGIVTDKPR